MNDWMLWIGRLAGVVGALICAVGILARVTGHFWISGYQVGTLFQGGIAAMVAGCFCFLWVQTRRHSDH